MASSSGCQLYTDLWHDRFTGRLKKNKRIRRALVVAAGIVCLWVIAVLSLQRLMIFPRYLLQSDPRAGQNVRGLVRLAVDSPEGEVEGWLLPGDGVGAGHPGPAVIFAHGNAELIEHWPEMLEPYRRLGVSVLLPEFRGYGRSAGSPSQAAITEDMAAFYDQLARRPEVDPARIIFHGRSLGGGAVCDLARRRKPAAVVLMSTFSSMKRMARRYLVPGFMVRDPFDSLDVVSRLDAPLLIVHGRHDSVVPYDHAEQLHAAAPGSALIGYDADHNDCPPDWTVLFADVTRFLREAKILPPSLGPDGV
jgi:fermentation-respiration switch protein FrsA (DUF1100 family)